MNHSHRIVFIASLLAFASANAGELMKDYFGATLPGDWVTQELTSPDGSKSTYTSMRLPDQDGHVVADLSVKVLAGPGAGAESKNTMVLPKDFNFARDWLSYGKFTEKMTMTFGSTVMPVDATTLKAIRNSSKDYRGAVNFETNEVVDGRTCDRYAYAVVIAGPPPSMEGGKLWLDRSVPFGVVRQTAQVLNKDGSVASSYQIRLTGTGGQQAGTSGGTSEPAKPAAPSVVGLLEGYNAGRVALDVTVAAGSAGRRLQVALRNTTDDALTVKLAAGEVSIPGDSPVSELAFTVESAADIVLAAGASSDLIPVKQNGSRGPQDGTFTLSVYEGTPLYSGEVTVGPLPR